MTRIIESTDIGPLDRSAPSQTTETETHALPTTGNTSSVCRFTQCDETCSTVVLPHND